MGLRIAFLLAVVLFALMAFWAFAFVIDPTPQKVDGRVADRAVLAFADAVPVRIQAFVSIHATECRTSRRQSQAKVRGESLDEGGAL